MSVTKDDLVSAFLYGFPIVFNLDQVKRYVSTGVGKNPAAPWNSFSHARSLAGPEDTFVSINNDTVYSVAMLDLSVGPILLSVPDTAGRYYVMQLVSAWTDNFAYIGHRATGTGAGQFLLVPHDWEGSAPEGATVVRVPTRIATIVGRWAVDGSDDLAAVHALQDATTLVPLQADAVAEGLQEPAAGGSEAEQFWAKYVAWSQEFPPAPRDADLHALTLQQVAAARADGGTLLEEAYAGGLQAIKEVLASGGGDAPSTAGSSPTTRSTTTSTTSRWAPSTSSSSSSPTPSAASCSAPPLRWVACGATRRSRPPTSPPTSTNRASPSPASTPTRSTWPRPRRSGRSGR